MQSPQLAKPATDSLSLFRKLNHTTRPEKKKKAKLKGREDAEVERPGKAKMKGRASCARQLSNYKGK